MALRVTSALLHRLTFDDAALWRPFYLKTFGHSRPCKPASHTPESSTNAELWQDYHLHIPQAKVVDTLIRRFQQTWEWAYKSRVLDLVELTRKGATCYAMPKVRFPPERWVARRDEPEQGMWRYEGEWSTDLKRFVREGYGACRFLNGNLYCGQWAHDMMHGQGVMFYGDGSVYDGLWCRNARYGKGTYKRPGRWTYCGDWKDGKRCGWGTLQFAPLDDAWRTCSSASGLSTTPGQRPRDSLAGPAWGGQEPPAPAASPT
ncbi:MORN repeat-containing protein [Acanthamoeba castellanii str. Neff]|uniref:MORN repeat-containing protein n=1 Tax=Acanthamoeba castellanii (strain ATCC 30010 / Neff) TaxID=1257118 RepID=L8H6R9_ACACF|nr:MORN repeat-containing protein [Acanthamoeba castellanii str. Neff]ELR20845.1 MORN repeat-containing protein [Acanthamoeba castellanii str. Neff]